MRATANDAPERSPGEGEHVCRVSHVSQRQHFPPKSGLIERKQASTRSSPIVRFKDKTRQSNERRKQRQKDTFGTKKDNNKKTAVPQRESEASWQEEKSLGGRSGVKRAELELGVP